MGKSVTVIIPVYNTKKYLERCLSSVINQTYKNYDVICVDDCSEDGSKDILKKYEGEYENIHCFFNDINMGQGQSRSLAIDRADGEYILFVDSDDYIAPDYIEHYMDVVENRDCDVVVGGFITDNGKKQRIHRISANSNMGCIISYSYACFKLYNKAFIQKNKINFSDFRKGEDIYFSLLLVVAGARHEFIDYCGYYYYANYESTTRTLTAEYNFEKSVSEMFDKLIKDERYKKNNVMKSYMEYAYIASMLNALLVFSRGCGYQVMDEKYKYFMNDLKRKFPDYKRNKQLYRWNKNGPSMKCQIAVLVVMNAMKIHLDRFIILLIGR